MIPMVSGIIELAMRVLAAMILPLYFGSEGIFYAEILAWIGAASLLAVSYYRSVFSLARTGTAHRR